LVASRSPLLAARRAIVRYVGEPFRTGFDPATFPDWLAARGFRLEAGESAGDAAARLLHVPPSRARGLRATRSHFALARRA
jgi:hypothetical protein